MNARLRVLLMVILGCWLNRGWAQSLPLPKLAINRRGDGIYMDSLARLARGRHYELQNRPTTNQNDTLRFKNLVYLGNLYKWWYAHRDSTLYFGTELVRQAHKSRNTFYEIEGKLILEWYYRNGDVNAPQALRLNFEVLNLLPRTTPYERVRIQTMLNLGDLYSLTQNYTNAIHYLTQAQQLLAKGLVHVEARNVNLLRIEVEQHLGGVYKQQNDFARSETHYLAAEHLLKSTPSETSQAFVYDDLGELYLKFSHYPQALGYAKKAEAIWDRIKTPTESHSWGTLSCIYAGLGQDELATQYARKVLNLPRPNKFIREQAYSALYQVAEHRQDWKNGTLYYKKYIAVRDTIAYDQRSLELVSIEKQADYDRFVLQSKQAQQLQNQRLLMTTKQAEVDRLRANVSADALSRKARFSEQQRLLDNERAKTALNRQRTAQRLQQQAFDQQVLQQQNQTQQNWLLFGTISFFLLLGLLALLLYSVQLRKRKVEADLRLAREREEADLRIIQNQESERQRIAADLHDDLGGTLATLHRGLTDLRQYLHEPIAVQTFENLQPLIQKSTADLRRIAHNLMPPEFARIGLHHALEHLVRTQPVHPTHFSFFTSGTARKLPVDTELNAYRIASELIQNVGKHAQANRAAVQLLYQDDRLTLTVEDDGLGSRATSTKNEPVGIGLKSSSLRADYIGATLWRDVSEAGTLVILEIPYPHLVYAT